MKTARPDSAETPFSLHPRRQFLGRCGRVAQGALLLASGVSGCVARGSASRRPDLIWSRLGLSDGRVTKPRAIAISPKDELFVVDMTGRIQAFSSDGEFLRGWRTPEIKQGKPTGLGFASDGTLLVADTHYFRVLFYSTSGQLDSSRTIGGTHGDNAGEFHFVTDVAEDPRGHFFVGQYGQVDRIQEFDPSGRFVRMWGSQGSNVGEFSRPQCLRFDSQGLLWVADACNHRLQIYDVASGDPAQPPKQVDCWGTPGGKQGELQYPYGLVFDTDGTLLISEYGNHRVQRFNRSGKSLELWGAAGSDEGMFLSPWALGLDSQRQLHVLDSLNHRVQRFQLG